ncbi:MULTISPECIES: RHS repeat-associated core domain-containing protein [Pseudomonas]|uniref:RHS repeat-associated core domain-containing protein n=1 Tax=Pseudomonas TaxID=286 RepID=UPI001E4336AA|nr:MULTISPECIES: RHS repeat-associated core domain-containing protein [Pseudomonas]MCE1116839.1 RHS repeat-associated core domain-containing protein [Pseudomonas sp. NMI795_08]
MEPLNVLPPALALLATDTPGSVLRRSLDQTRSTFTYTAFGHSTPGNGGLVMLGFNGQYCDPVTGLYLLGNGYRAYSTVLMRFISSDNLSPMGAGGINAYAYCAGDPINKTDPSGHLGYGRKLKVLPAPKLQSIPAANLESIPEPDVFKLIVSYLPARDALALSRTSRHVNKLTAPILSELKQKLSDRLVALRTNAGANPGIHRSYAVALNPEPHVFHSQIQNIEGNGGAQQVLANLRETRAERARWNKLMPSPDSSPDSSDSEVEMQRVNEGIRRALHGPQF